MVSQQDRQIVVEALFAKEPYLQSSGYRLVEVGIDFVHLEMTIRPDMLNGAGLAHGGVIFALADTALAYAANADNALSLTFQASITYLASATIGDHISAKAQNRFGSGRNRLVDVEVRRNGTDVIAILNGVARSIGKPAVT